MAKKASIQKSTLINDVKKLLNHILSHLFSTIERHAVLILLIAAALVMIINGIRLFAESLFASSPGLGDIILGIVILIIASICKKFWKI